LIIRPAWIVVDILRLVHQGAVDLHHFARDGGVQIGRGFHRFDDAELCAGLDVIPHFGQLDIHDVAQLILGKRGDAHDVEFAVGFDPLVFGGVAPIGGVGG
jgi:hypothetical protein